MHHFCVYVCAHTCRQTPFISLDRNTTIRNIYFFIASVAAIWILSLGRQEGRWKGKGYPFSLFILTLRGGEAAHVFSVLSRDLVAQEQLMQSSICTEQGM